MKKLIIEIFILLLLSTACADRQGFTTSKGKFIPKEEIVDYKLETWGWYGEKNTTFIHTIKDGDSFFFQITFTLKDGTKYGIRQWYEPKKYKIESIEYDSLIDVIDATPKVISWM